MISRASKYIENVRALVLESMELDERYITWLLEICYSFIWFCNWWNKNNQATTGPTNVQWLPLFRCFTFLPKVYMKFATQLQSVVITEAMVFILINLHIKMSFALFKSRIYQN